MKSGAFLSTLQQLPVAKRRRIRQIRDRQAQLQSIIGLKLVKLGFNQLRLRNFHLQKLHFSEHKPTIQQTHARTGASSAIGHFSISHSQSCICCAISKNKMVGIDVEKIRALSLNLINKYQLHQNNIGNNTAPITRWTQKEAIFKVIGESKLHELKDITINQDKLNQASALFKNRQYHINSFTLDKKYTMSIASLQPNTKIKIKRVYF